jgi:hypothetical protein
MMRIGVGDPDREPANATAGKLTTPTQQFLNLNGPKLTFF